MVSGKRWNLLAVVALGITTVAVRAQAPANQPRLVLKALDTDGDGTLSAAELATSSRSLLTLDLNKDGQLTADELSSRPQNAGASAEELVRQLMAFDKNGDGVLSADELPARMQSLFQRADTNKDGKLTPEEIRALARRQGMPNGRPAEPGHAEGMFRMDPLLNALDLNHDGILSAEEIAAAPASLAALDRNHDGQITPDEMQVRQMTPAERAQHMLDEWDTNKDGLISKAEAPDRMQQQFSTIDKDGDGFLNKEELTAYFANMPQRGNERPRQPQSEEKH